MASASVPVHVAPFGFPGGHGDFSLLPGEVSAAAFFAAAEDELAPALAEAVRGLLLRERGLDRHRGGRLDAVLHWAPRVARECGVPHVTFQTIGAFAAAAMVAIPGHLHLHEAMPDPFGVDEGFPVPVNLRGVQVNEEALAHLPLFRSAEADSLAVVVNSFAALEADFAEYYVAWTGLPRSFLSHCGCNLTLDAVSAGVPLATWPLRAEQFLNEAFLVDVLRVGVRVRDAAMEAVVPGKAVAREVGRLMGDEDDAEARRARAAELSVLARAAVADGGSSCSDWPELINQLKPLHHHHTDTRME
uniref:Uncharacterized protein n=1 Tax=Oryza punctata TaxID=4537 RepID=A0A0E0KIE7_ORYPU